MSDGFVLFAQYYDSLKMALAILWLPQPTSFECRSALTLPVSNYIKCVNVSDIALQSVSLLASVRCSTLSRLLTAPEIVTSMIQTDDICADHVP